MKNAASTRAVRRGAHHFTRPHHRGRLALLGTAAVLALGLGVATAVHAQSVANAILTGGMNSCTLTPCGSSGVSTSQTTPGGAFVPSGTTTFNQSTQTTNTTVTLSNNPLNYSIGGGGNSASIMVGATPSSYITSAGSGLYGASQYTLTYYFEVVPLNGQTGTATLTADATGSVFAQGAQPAVNVIASAQMIITGADAGINDLAGIAFYSSNGTIVNQPTTLGVGFVSNPTTTGGVTTETGGFNESGTVSVALNTQYSVSLGTYVTCNSGTCSASIDPSFKVPVGYELIQSEGFGNVANVPEPSALVLSGVGLLSIAFMRRRKSV